MLFAILAAAGSGLAIGLRFRVNMLFAASGVFGIGTIATALLLGWSLAHTIAVLIILLGLQQSAYLIGLVLNARSAKPRSERVLDTKSSTAGSGRSAESVKKH